MKKILTNICLGFSALISIAIVTKMTGHPPQGLMQMILYAFPGGIIMVLLFNPLLKLVSIKQSNHE